MADLLKHNKFPYCGKSDCEFFNTCGQALTEELKERAARENLNVPLKEHCAPYYHPMSASTKGEKK